MLVRELIKHLVIGYNYTFGFAVARHVCTITAVSLFLNRDACDLEVGVRDGRNVAVCIFYPNLGNCVAQAYRQVLDLNACTVTNFYRCKAIGKVCDTIFTVNGAVVKDYVEYKLFVPRVQEVGVAREIGDELLAQLYVGHFAPVFEDDSNRTS